MLEKKLAETRTEAEEARWFEENQDRLLKLFEQAGKEGALRIGGKSVGITLSKKTESLRETSPHFSQSLPRGKCRGRKSFFHRLPLPVAPDTGVVGPESAFK